MTRHVGTKHWRKHRLDSLIKRGQAADTGRVTLPEHKARSSLGNPIAQSRAEAKSRNKGESFSNRNDLWRKCSLRRKKKNQVEDADSQYLCATTKGWKQTQEYIARAKLGIGISNLL